MAGKQLFKSGVNFGGGLTKVLNEEIVDGVKYMDTPGLADKELRIAAGEAISKALKAGGKYKILFFVRLESGRPSNEDITTMKLVLDAAPQIGQQYGVIIPSVGENSAKFLRQDLKGRSFS